MDNVCIDYTMPTEVGAANCVGVADLGRRQIVL